MAVTDTFSLRGFSPAYAAINKACPPQVSTITASTPDLTDAERTRILAKSALFNPPPAQLPDGRRDLVGLTREELAAGTRRHRREAVPRQAALALDLPPGRDRLLAKMSSIARPLQERLAERFVIGRPSVATDAGQRGRDPQVAVPFPRRAGSRDRVYSRPARGPRRRVHLVPGWLHPVLPVLPHRHADAGAQPGRGRDRRPVHGGARRLRRVAQPARGRRRACCPPSC